jgi:hypothetical protein
MAITTINLTDPLGTLVTKTNTISGGLGDVATLFTGDDNTVDAINAIQGFLDSNKTLIDAVSSGVLDSANVISISRTGLSVNDTNGGGIELSYDSATGSITITSRLVSTSQITYDSSAGSFSIAADAVSQTELANVVSLQIYDSTGTLLKTIYGAGS